MAILNKINQSSSQKKKRFNIRYILAEIFLITAGILIALAIDNWNTDREEQKMIEKYLIEMYKEYSNEIERMEKRKIDLNLELDKNTRALNIIKNSQYDSIQVLENLLLGLGNPVSDWKQFPITKEFLDQNLLYKIKNEKLKGEYKNFTFWIDVNKELKDFAREQYLNTTEPFINSNINFSTLCCPNMNSSMIQGGPKTNYKLLMNNMELWNTLSFRREFILINSGIIDGQTFFLKNIIEEITNEVGKENLIEPAEMDEFKKVMQGIGFFPQIEEDRLKVAYIDSKGTAFKAGLNKGDIILMVTQPGEEPIDISGMDVFDVMKLVTGPIGTTVVLTVERSDGTIEDVSVVRDVVK